MMFISLNISFISLLILKTLSFIDFNLCTYYCI